ncbi:hypothetical protein [Deinococcus psychrotolerans]|uniref:hypothetical protein n=1 Tax=Deinococcus psychrotolerans TaxID=2489213 RepID=UPI001F150820|nr:hypothetical protein [Deinococcus psychrotolerans]
MRKKMQLVSAVAFGLYGLAAAQSSEHTTQASKEQAAPKQALKAAATPLPLSLSGSLTQQLTRAALIIHGQAPLWPAELKPEVKAAPAVPSAATKTAVSKGTPGAPLPAFSVATLPQLPSGALIGQVVSQAAGSAESKPVQTSPVQAKAAPTKLATLNAAPVVQEQLQRQLEVSAAVTQIAALAAQPAPQVKAPVAAPKPEAKLQVKPQVAAPKPQPVKAPRAVNTPANSPVVSRPQQRGYSRVVKATAYSSDVGQTDNSPFVTATGTRVRPGVIALSRDLLRIFPYGSRVTLQDSAGLLNGRTFIVEDTMNVRISNTIDIWMGSRAQAYQWGVRSVTITAVR